MAKKETTKPDFEKSLQELESLVQKMESGELSLEESLQEFERGVQLTRQCQEALTAAEQRVKLLAADGSQTDFKEDKTK
ncbi:exodeoxyribonuclease VII small subunit [uncultured Thiothrix sp.]|uniref:exodeoxyribonuclease VII small subunit n=1 Tax=uncultured Thiothrix sp. TaxID=223185 RepID=UPI002625559E|nr:exodeoxyribonuclease VII small subunit [uncultured Thiothrix sp.]